MTFERVAVEQLFNAKYYFDQKRKRGRENEAENECVYDICFSWIYYAFMRRN